MKRTTPLKRTPFKKSAKLRAVKARPMRRSKSTTTPTKEEQEWMAWIRAYGCVACHLDGLGTTAPENTAVHHILSGGRRMGHLFTLPLCDPGHHQNPHTLGMIPRHPFKAQFEARYGSELYLLEYLKLKRTQTP